MSSPSPDQLNDDHASPSNRVVKASTKAVRRARRRRERILGAPRLTSIADSPLSHEVARLTRIRDLGLGSYGALASVQTLLASPAIEMLRMASPAQMLGESLAKQILPVLPIQNQLAKITADAAKIANVHSGLLSQIQGLSALAFPSSARLLNIAYEPMFSSSLSRVAALIAPMQAMAARVARIPWLVFEAEAALDAYVDGKSERMFRFMATRLKIRRPTEDHAQALALALLTQDWKASTDLRDPDAVRLALRRLAAAGDDREANHQVAGDKIASLEYLQSRDVPLPFFSEPGHEEAVVATLVSWVDRLDSRHVRNVIKRLNQLESDVTRTWAEDTFPHWSEAVLPHGLEPQFGVRVQRKLRRHGKEIARRQGILREKEEK